MQNKVELIISQGSREDATQRKRERTLRSLQREEKNRTL